jgi:hypothetical protein
MSPNKRHISRERRSFPRVDDNIVLMWRRVEPLDIPDELPHDENHLFFYPLESQLNLLGLESSYLLKPIREQSPLLAEYLKNLEQKIDILARTISVMDEVASHPTRSVNLSASGIAFLTDAACHKDTLLEIKMILPPTLQVIVAYARVVDCTSDDDHGVYTLAATFIRMKDYDRDHLIRHVARRQAVLRSMQAAMI